VILCDIMLPALSGIEFIRQVRQTDTLVSIPIVAMTAYDQELLDQALAAGATAKVHKLQMDRVVATVRQSITGRAMAAEEE
jgi:CheY-like chemotaxis protein